MTSWDHERITTHQVRESGRNPCPNFRPSNRRPRACILHKSAPACAQRAILRHGNGIAFRFEVSVSDAHQEVGVEARAYVSFQP
jgi:hypothetical protein